MRIGPDTAKNITRLFLAIGLMTFAVACQVSGTGLGPTISAGEIPDTDPNTPVVNRTMPEPVMRIPGLPIPSDVEVILADTVIAGQDDSWNGQVVLFSKKYQAVQFVEFMRTEMPNMGWQETSVLRSRRTSISFVKDERFATVRIMQRDDGAEVDIVVAPIVSPGANTN